MQSLVRPFVGIAVLFGTLTPFVLSSRTPRPLPGGTALKQLDSDSLFTMKVTSPTAVQDALPTLFQRGVQLDGRLRAAPQQHVVVAANPFEDVWRAPTLGGINLAMGTYEVQDVDIALPAAVMWTIGRGYNARQESSGTQRDSNPAQGRDWFQTSQPEISFYDDANNAKDLIVAFYAADRFAEYKRVDASGPTFRGVNGAAGVFKSVPDAGAGPDTYVFTDQNGDELTFFAFDNDSGVAKGQLWKITDPAGNVSYVGDSSTASTAISNGFDAGGRILTAYDSANRRYSYTYSTLDSVVRLTQVKAETKTGGTWASPSGVATAMTVDYGYYTDESHGDKGDLKQVTITTPLTDSGVSLVQKKLYRYWEGSSDGTSNYNASTNPGYVHALKYVVDFEGVRRYDWLDTTFDDDQLSASDASLEPYSSAYFEYDSSHRIRKVWFNGECGCSGGTNGTYQFEYETNGSFSDTANTYDSGWKTRTVVQRPDTSYMTQYWDEIGQPLSQVITDADPDNTGPSPSRWVTRVERDSSGSVSKIGTPANCTGYTHSTGAITASSSVGLIWEFTRSGSGAMTGFVTVKKYREGTSGTLYYDSEIEYTQADKVIIASPTAGYCDVTRPGLNGTTRYPQYATSTSSTYKNTHSVGWDGSAVISIVSDQVTQPAITTGTNGSNSALSWTQYYTVDGRPSYTKARDGVISYRSYTNGQVTTSIEDADTSILSDEPGGLSSTGTPFHRVTTYTYDPQGRLDVQTNPDGGKEKHYYSRLADERLIELVYADYETSPSLKVYGPVSYTVTNQADEIEAEATVGLTNNESTTALTGHVDESSADPIAAMDLGDVVRLTTTVYNESGHTAQESRLYYDVPGSGAGYEGTNYDATFFGYDDNGRRVRVKEPSGTIRRTVFDLLGRVTSRSMGTNDPDTVGTDDMVTTEALEYDGNSDNGNSYLTKCTLYVEDSSTGQRVTTYTNDVRGRAILQTNPTAPHVFRKYDNEGRVVASGLFSSTGSIVVGTDDPTTETSNRLALTESSYDEVGQMWKSVRHNIDAGDGSDDDTLEHLWWRDAEGRVIKEDGPDLVKTCHDRLGRETNRFVLCEDNDSLYTDVDDVSGDYVMEEHQTVYESGTSDDVLMTVRIDRTHNDWGGGSTTGALDTGADADLLLLTAANLKGRAQIICSWYDRFGRVTDQVLYGDYGGSNFDRDGLSVPSRSDTALVTTYAYGTDGVVLTTTDPRGLVAKTERDDAGRVTKQIKNYSAGVNSGNPANPDDNQTVRYEYVDGLRTKIVADMPSGEDDQETVYIYGTTKGTPSASKVASGHLLRALKYPDTGNTGTTPANIDSDSSDVVSSAYNAQGQEVYHKDQAGNEFTIEYDDAGREMHRRVSTLASGFDGAVRRQSRTYDSLGRPSLVTQYDAASSGSVTDEASYTYDGWGDITSFKEDRDGAVGGGSGFYETQYTYAKATTGRNTVRRSQITLPGGKTVSIDYTKDKDGSCSRVSRLKIGATVLARYDYLGEGRVVRTQYPQADIVTRLFDPSNDAYGSYLDRFNRVIKNVWATEIPNPDVNFYDVDVSYDRNSNITWVEDNVHLGFDVKYTMDDLDRLIDAEEGTRSGGSITSRTRHQTWMQSGTSQLSHTGNWTRSKLDLDGNDNWTGTREYDDTRASNKVNELTARDTDSNGSTNYTLAYDAAGDMTDDGQSYKYEYDAFYRLRRVKSQGGTLLAEYRYNGLWHMISVHEDTDADGDVDGSDVTFCPAYDERWREVARYRDGDSSPKEQFVNAMAGLDGYGGSSYINDVVCRERDNSNGWLGNPDGTLEERYYYCQNWRGDASALVHSGRYMAEWDKYSAYGIPFGLPGADTNSDGNDDAADATQIQTWINGALYDVRGDVDLDGDVDATDKVLATGAPIAGNVLAWGNLSDDAFKSRAGFAGYSLLVPNEGARHRIYAAGLGSWLERDFTDYVDGPNLYAYAHTSPVKSRDPSGLVTYEQSEGTLPPDSHINCRTIQKPRCRAKCALCLKCIKDGAKRQNPGCMALQDLINKLSGQWDVVTTTIGGGYSGKCVGNWVWFDDFGPYAAPGGTIEIDPAQDAPAIDTDDQANSNVLPHEIGHALIHDYLASLSPPGTDADQTNLFNKYHDNALPPNLVPPLMNPQDINWNRNSCGCIKKCNFKGCR